MTATAATPPYEALGERIRRARVRKGISQEAFAPMVGVTRRHLIRIEKGRHRPSDALLARIAEATGQQIVEPQEAALPGDPFRDAGGSPRRARRGAGAAERTRGGKPVSEDSDGRAA